MRILFTALIFIGIGATFLLSCQDTHAEGGVPIHGVYEEYLQTESMSHHQGTKLAYSYLTARADLTPKIAVVGGVLNEYGGTLLDENYISADALGGAWKFGRFRTSFGLSSWGEQYYTGLPREPLIRSNYYPDWFGLSLHRIDTGVEYKKILGTWQFTAAVIDPRSDNFQLAPKTTNHIALRAQTYFDSWIIGANMIASTQSNNLDGKNLKMYDIDARWTAPGVQLRGEAIETVVGHLKSDSYYADISYHSLKLPNTTFIVRSEYINFAHIAVWNASAYTIGARQIICPNLTMELSQCWGNHSAMVDYDRGTTLDLITSVPF